MRTIFQDLNKLAIILFFSSFSFTSAKPINTVYQNAVRAYSNQKFEEAIKLFTSCAEQGHTNSMYALAKMYRRGQKVAKNNVIAFYYISRASEQGHKSAKSIREKYCNLIFNHYEKLVTYKPSGFLRVIARSLRGSLSDTLKVALEFLKENGMLQQSLTEARTFFNFANILGYQFPEISENILLTYSPNFMVQLKAEAMLKFD